MPGMNDPYSLFSFPLDICGNPTTLGCQTVIALCPAVWWAGVCLQEPGTLPSGNVKEGL